MASLCDLFRSYLETLFHFPTESLCERDALWDFCGIRIVKLISQVGPSSIISVVFCFKNISVCCFLFFVRVLAALSAIILILYYMLFN